jgi:HlyD family secretion protein
MKLRALAAAAALLAGGILIETARPEQRDVAFQGWVEANFLFIGADEIGRVEALSVREGETVEAGAILFTVDSELQAAAVRQDEATLVNAQQAFNRAQDLLKSGSGTKKEFDAARSTLEETQAKVSSARTRLTRRKIYAPASGVIQDVYFRAGEVVPASRPIVSLLPPGNIKLRFFVPEASLPQIRRGDAVQVTCDGCAPQIAARIDFISKKAEYTPPVIYSLEERSKLVFLIEARPDQPELLRVGQPVRIKTAMQKAGP